jgi:hypothetical protein
MAGLSEVGCALGLIFVLGFILVILRSQICEGFSSGGGRGPAACGVDMPCGGQLKCINGFCAKTEKVDISEKAPVELLPSGSPAPYF